MNTLIEPKFLKIITSEKDEVEDREDHVNTLLVRHDYVSEEERGVEFLGLRGNCYSFKIDGIAQAYDILYLFRETRVDENDIVTEMRYEGETLTVTMYK